MAITHFVITQLPDPNYITSTIGVNPLQVDLLYPIADQANIKFERIASLLGWYVSGEFKYKVYDEVELLYSNESIGSLEWKADDSIRPLSENRDVIWQEGQSSNLLDILPINNQTEFIDISFVNSSMLLLNGEPVQNYQRLSVQEMLNAIYTAEDNITSDKFYTFKYKVGRNGVLEPEVYDYAVTVEYVNDASIDPGFKEASPLGESYTVTVNSEVPWEVTSFPSWVQLTTTSGEGTGTFDVMVDQNNTGAARSGFINVTSGEVLLESAINQEAQSL